MEAVAEQMARPAGGGLASLPGTRAVLGGDNEQETMNREIKAAAEAGVDFFSILWYYNPPGHEREPNVALTESRPDQLHGFARGRPPAVHDRVLQPPAV